MSLTEWDEQTGHVKSLKQFEDNELKEMTSFDYTDPQTKIILRSLYDKGQVIKDILSENDSSTQYVYTDALLPDGSNGLKEVFCYKNENLESVAEFQRDENGNSIGVKLYTGEELEKWLNAQSTSLAEPQLSENRAEESTQEGVQEVPHIQMAAPSEEAQPTEPINVSASEERKGFVEKLKTFSRSGEERKTTAKPDELLKEAMTPKNLDQLIIQSIKSQGR